MALGKEITSGFGITSGLGFTTSMGLTTGLALTSGLGTSGVAFRFRVALPVGAVYQNQTSGLNFEKFILRHFIIFGTP